MTEQGQPVMRFRPTFWASVWAMITLAILIALGTWQIQRMFWKAALIAERQDGFNAAAVALPGQDQDVPGILWRRVTVTGEFLNEQEIYLAARSLRSNVGWHILTPFLRDTGQTVMVNRGWVPQDRRDPAARAEGQIQGTVTIEGIATPGARKGPFTPDNDIENNVWLWADLAAISKTLETRVQPLVLDALDEANPGGFPIGGQTRINLPNDHLQYALTWYALAVALAVIYVIYHRRREDETPEG